MNSQVAKTFTFADINVRTAGTSDNPLFCLRDVCVVLEIKNHNNKTSLLRADQKHVIHTLDSIGRKQKKIFCTESGLYRVIMSCRRNPRAEAFQDFVCDEVLPQLRRTGSYSLPRKQDNRIEQRRLDLEYCRFAAEMYPECDRMRHLVKEKMASNLSVGNLITQEAMPLTVTEILEQTQGLERKLIYKHRSRFGRLVVGAWRKDRNCEPKKVVKYCNAHSCQVNAYPQDYHETVRTMWLNFVQNSA